MEDTISAAAARRDAASFTPQPSLQDPFKPFKPFSSRPDVQPVERAVRAAPARSQRKRNALDPLAEKAAHHRTRAAQINRDAEVADMEREERVLKQDFDLKNPLPKLTDGYEHLDDPRAAARASKAVGGKAGARRGPETKGAGKTPASGAPPPARALATASASPRSSLGLVACEAAIGKALRRRIGGWARPPLRVSVPRQPASRVILWVHPPPRRVVARSEARTCVPREWHHLSTN